MTSLLNGQDTFRPLDHQTHRRYAFHLPADCDELRIGIHYAPKYLTLEESRALSSAAVHRQQADIARRVGESLATDWSRPLEAAIERTRVPNLLTISLDDADGVYRGAGHRHAPDQSFGLEPRSASPGFMPGPLPHGVWTLTVSAHTLVSHHVTVSIQIGALMASSRS